MLLPLYTLTLIQKYTCIILSLLLYIYTHIYMNRCCANSDMFLPVGTLTLRTSLYTIHISTSIHISYDRYLCIWTQVVRNHMCLRLASVHFETLCIQTHTHKCVYIYRYSCTWTHAVQTHICVCPLRVLTQWNFLYTSTFSEVYIYHIIDSFVYEPMLCKLKYVCDLASAHT